MTENKPRELVELEKETKQLYLDCTVLLNHISKVHYKMKKLAEGEQG